MNPVHFLNQTRSTLRPSLFLKSHPVQLRAVYARSLENKRSSNAMFLRKKQQRLGEGHTQHLLRRKRPRARSGFSRYWIRLLIAHGAVCVSGGGGLWAGVVSFSSHFLLLVTTIEINRRITFLRLSKNLFESGNIQFSR